MSISVLICCYNGEQYLRETLDSVLAQTVQPLEVIVIDDGSTDDSASIARSFGDPVRVVQQENRGLPASRNVAISEAKGDFIFFIDADDLLHPRALEELLIATDGRKDIVPLMGFSSFVTDANDPFSTTKFEQNGFFPKIIKGNFGPNHNRLVARELANRAGGFDAKMYIFEDWLFWTRVALQNAKLVSIPFVGAYYRRHSQTMSFTASRKSDALGHVRVMNELASGVLKQPEIMAEHGQDLFWGCWGALSRGCSHGLEDNELMPLARSISNLVRQGPPEISDSRTAKIVRMVGVRQAVLGQRLFSYFKPYRESPRPEEDLLQSDTT